MPVSKKATLVPVAALSNDRTVRVKVAAKMLYDFDIMTRVMRDVLGRLGCQACCSGHDIRFEIEREFTVGDDLKAKPGIE